MRRGAHYTRPTKKIRNLKSIVSYLKLKIPPIKVKKKDVIPKSQLTTAPLTYTTLYANPKHPYLTSSTFVTNFPELCSVCDMHECHYNMNHQISYSISGAFTNAFSGVFKEKKPPDQPPSPSSWSSSGACGQTAPSKWSELHLAQSHLIMYISCIKNVTINSNEWSNEWMTSL